MLHHLTNNGRMQRIKSSELQSRRVMRPMLSLVLADESIFNLYNDHLLSSQGPENQQQLDDAWNKLLQDMSRNLESENRERFTQKLTGRSVLQRETAYLCSLKLYIIAAAAAILVFTINN